MGAGPLTALPRALTPAGRGQGLRRPQPEREPDSLRSPCPRPAGVRARGSAVRGPWPGPHDTTPAEQR